MKISDSVAYIGVNDYDADLFEGQYKVEHGMAYNSYVVKDDKIAVMDTVDKKFGGEWLGKLEGELGGRKPDYLVVQHMEPDHSANVLAFAEKYPDAVIVASNQAFNMMKLYFGTDFADRRLVVKEGDTLALGRHELVFVAAPMVHWPEVIVTYEKTEKLLFSADAFGKFGTTDADEDWACEARRYYFGIVGKYGAQAQNLLKKAAALDIRKILPLHGPILTENLGYYINLYNIWSTYGVESDGVVIAYTSVYGHTLDAVKLLEKDLADAGVKVVVHDLARCDMAEAVEDAFRYGKLVLATTTYNADIFPFMKTFIDALTERNYRNRKIGLIENGSWAPTSGKLMREIMSGCKDMRILDETLTLKSSLKPEQTDEIDALVKAISDTIPRFEKPVIGETDKDILKIDPAVFHKFSYGLFVLTTQADSKDNGCIINTAAQLTSTPGRINIAVNKANYTHDMILKSGVFNLSILAEDASFDTFKRFGFASGKDTDKFAGFEAHTARSGNGLTYVTLGTNAFISAKVIDAHDYGTHTLFIAEVTESQVLRDMPSVTYGYYFEHIKPKPQPKIEEEKHGYVCKICGYVYEGDTLPPDFVCPLCKHGADDFEKI